ncbi:hypothetical protein Tph_c23810 [Thermacetogenium phaeum DSM 12270]|uniref:Uncharacterized protein n=1 Tax=Thermacetogenium phaeum (strain ATCC BAA-254 / DSM 26808 / PB) TaxID=1089553 RepID=K4LI52_THEPS|nr:hypothetical protein [Thermacetogenium phaeum]AFV12568.1 hypothetical protein Tph_c23810 [Thermacetogenium phaeum DSM 12270]MDN5365701.1 hypothetical protein [Thermacetogenium sp.]
MNAEMNRNEMIGRIVDFVREHGESQATVAVCRRVLGYYPEQFDSKTLSQLRASLAKAGQEEVESCYYLIM